MFHYIYFTCSRIIVTLHVHKLGQSRLFVNEQGCMVPKKNECFWWIIVSVYNISWDINHQLKLEVLHLFSDVRESISMSSGRGVSHLNLDSGGHMLQ